MMNPVRRFIVVLIVLPAFLISCQSGNKKEEFYDDNGQLVIREWYNKTSLKSRTTYLNEEKYDYVFVAYFEDGRLKDSARFINNLISGERKFYESDLGLMHYENYKDGLYNGYHKAIYDNGVSSFEGYRLNGFKVGEWGFHYPDGRPITYEYYDSTGEIRYFRKYDNKGTSLKTEGSGIIKIYPEKLSIRVSDTIRGIAEVASPPNSEIELSIIEVTSSYNSHEFFKTEVKYPKVYWSRKFKNPGQKKLNFMLKIKDLKSGKVETSVFEQKLVVTN